MNYKLHRTEKRLNRIFQDNEILSPEIIRSKYLEKEPIILDFSNGRFNDKYKSLLLKIYKAIDEYPKIKSYLQKISEEVDINEKYINNKLEKLINILDYTETFNIVTIFSGFDSAASQYGKNIYFGLEWFINPDLMDISKDNPIYQHLKRISINPEKFIDETLVHEFVHLVTDRVKSNDDFYWHLIEEGRAVYITNLIEANNELPPLKKHVVEWCSKNKEFLLQKMKDTINNRDYNEYPNFFSPQGNINGYSFTGYYIGYYLIKKYVEKESSIEKKINKLIKMQTSKEIEEILNSY